MPSFWTPASLGRPCTSSRTSSTGHQSSSTLSYTSSETRATRYTETDITNSISSVRKLSKNEIQEQNNYKQVIWVCLKINKQRHRQRRQRHRQRDKNRDRDRDRLRHRNRHRHRVYYFCCRLRWPIWREFGQWNIVLKQVHWVYSVQRYAIIIE